MTLGMRVTDVDDAFALEIRRGIAEFHREIPEDADVLLSMTKNDVDRVLTGQTSFAASARDGSIQIQRGDADDVDRFFAYFETPDVNAIRLLAR
jgi:alkyl sulfatase BDS1-like metallo-beta-lactamase superfamily hydrolase